MAGDFLRHLIATSATIRIVHTSLFSFFYYLTIGLLLAVLPGFVHLHLGLSPLWAGVAVSSQYLATLLTRPSVGRMTDVSGPRATVLLGQATGLLSGLCLLAAASLQSKDCGLFCRSSDQSLDPWLWRKLRRDGRDHLGPGTCRARICRTSDFLEWNRKLRGDGSGGSSWYLA